MHTAMELFGSNTKVQKPRKPMSCRTYGQRGLDVLVVMPGRQRRCAVASPPASFSGWRLTESIEQVEQIEQTE
jgi:hypothetical protein